MSKKEAIKSEVLFVLSTSPSGLIGLDKIISLNGPNSRYVVYTKRLERKKKKEKRVGEK